MRHSRTAPAKGRPRKPAEERQRKTDALSGDIV